ncbi:MAG: ABC-2 type transport system ATP-binding protein [Colwellia sp.]|jgi:ABC-2 type transport system ATP-binding protein
MTQVENSLNDTKNNIIEVNRLVKTYKGVQAVDGISFAITKGHCFGLLGPKQCG